MMQIRKRTLSLLRRASLSTVVVGFAILPASCLSTMQAMGYDSFGQFVSGCPCDCNETAGAAAAGAGEEATKEPAEQVTQRSSNYLEKIYNDSRDKMRRENKILEDLGNEFRAQGFAMRKDFNDRSLISQLASTIDGDMAFATGSANLTPAALEIVDGIGDAMAENPNTIVRIYGHTDTPGNRAGNLRLSQRRAEAVRDALVRRRGIARDRIVDVQGFADDKKIIDTTASEPRNRRTEILMAFRE